MRPDYDHNLKDVIEQLIKTYRWGGKINERRIIESWKTTMGTMIDRHTDNLQVKDKTLFVSLDSSALRNELMMARSKIVKNLNKEIGKEVLEDVVFR